MVFTIQRRQQTPPLSTDRKRERKKTGHILWPHVHTTKTLQNTAKAIFRCCDPPQKQQLLQTQLFSAYRRNKQHHGKWRNDKKYKKLHSLLAFINCKSRRLHPNVHWLHHIKHSHEMTEHHDMITISEMDETVIRITWKNAGQQTPRKAKGENECDHTKYKEKRMQW